MSLSESLDWLSVVGPKIPANDHLKVVVCPRFSCLSELKKEIQTHNYPIIMGSQDLSPFDAGSFTGEEPAVLLKELVSMSIIGHSERRDKFGETDQMIADKAALAEYQGIEPVLCIQNSDTPVPPGVKIVAYEPVFAIGTGTPDTPDNAEKIASEVRSRRNGLSILYGGSVTSENCASFISENNIIGLLIGKASLDPREFLKIIENCNKV